MDDGSKKRKVGRTQVANACLACRSAKLKCSGGHPSCSRCSGRDIHCMYDVSEGMTKRQQLRLDLHEQKDELDRAMSLLNYLQQGTDQEATEMLARLRIGQSIESEYQRIQARPAAGYGSDRNLSSSYSQGPNDPMDDDLSRQNHRLLSLLTPQMQAHLYSNNVRDRRSTSSGASNSISHAVHDWVSTGEGSMAWIQEDFANNNPQTLESTTRHSVANGASPQNYCTHQQRLER